MKATVIKELREFFGQLETMQARMEELAAEARDAYDERSDKWKEGEAGEKMDTEINNLEMAASYCENSRDSLSEIEGMND